jgi:hypothetical protein
MQLTPTNFVEAAMPSSTDHATEIKTRALEELDIEMSDHLGIPVKDLATRRQQTNSMYDMLRSIQDGGTIFGEGFYIKREPHCFAVFRRGIGIQRIAPRVVSVATLFTPRMFFEGIL